jgi:hypothetical protein
MNNVVSKTARVLTSALLMAVAIALQAQALKFGPGGSDSSTL